jgi:hypothetical protein
MPDEAPVAMAARRADADDKCPNEAEDTAVSPGRAALPMAVRLPVAHSPSIAGEPHGEAPPDARCHHRSGMVAHPGRTAG